MAIENGTTVQLHYTGRLESGEVFDSSEGRGPLEFEVGAGMVIPGFENGVVGMDVGEKKTLTIPPEEAYGEHDPDLIRPINKEQLGGQEVNEGDVLPLQTQDGRQFQATVKAQDDESVTLDFNHFLAGKTLVFDIEIVEVG